MYILKLRIKEQLIDFLSQPFVWVLTIDVFGVWWRFCSSCICGQYVQLTFYGNLFAINFHCCPGFLSRLVHFNSIDWVIWATWAMINEYSRLQQMQVLLSAWALRMLTPAYFLVCYKVLHVCVLTFIFVLITILVYKNLRLIWHACGRLWNSFCW